MNFYDLNSYSKIKSTLYIFRYNDLCEMPHMIIDLMRSCNFSYFMFIPSKFVRNAFSKMIDIFERNQIRIEYVKKNDNKKNDKTLELEKILINAPLNFIGILQKTLINFLGCPIPLFSPAQ